MKNTKKYLDAPLLDSCLVTPPGAGKAIMTGAVAGAVAGSAARAAGDTLADHRGGDASPLRPGASSLGLLALTADEVVLFDGRRGMVSPVATGLAGRASRGELVDAQLGSGKLSSPLRLTWADGSSWELEVPRSHVKKARALIERAAA
jgi:hypothetical protein